MMCRYSLPKTTKLLLMPFRLAFESKNFYRKQKSQVGEKFRTFRRFLMKRKSFPYESFEQ